MPFLKSLTGEVEEMWALVLSQHQKTLTSLTTFNKDLAREIILIEERVNSCEQFIESDCEQYFSLKDKQEIDISFAMFALKTARRLEILGDLAKKMANDILSMPSSYPYELVDKTNVSETFRMSIKIIELALHAFDETDALVAQVALNRIGICRETMSEANRFLADYLRSNVQQTLHVFQLFSVLEGLRRTLEVSENICLNIFNYKQAALAHA